MKKIRYAQQQQDLNNKSIKEIILYFENEGRKVELQFKCITGSIIIVGISLIMYVLWNF